jgi:hypothetical protein
MCRDHPWSVFIMSKMSGTPLKQCWAEIKMNNAKGQGILGHSRILSRTRRSCGRFETP